MWAKNSTYICTLREQAIIEWSPLLLAATVSQHYVQHSHVFAQKSTSKARWRCTELSEDAQHFTFFRSMLSKCVAIKEANDRKKAPHNVIKTSGTSQAEGSDSHRSTSDVTSLRVWVLNEGPCVKKRTALSRFLRGERFLFYVWNKFFWVQRNFRATKKLGGTAPE